METNQDTPKDSESSPIIIERLLLMSQIGKEKAFDLIFRYRNGPRIFLREKNLNKFPEEMKEARELIESVLPDSEDDYDDDNVYNFFK